MSSTCSLIAGLMLYHKSFACSMHPVSCRILQGHLQALQTSPQQLEIRVLSGAQNNAQKMVPVHYLRNVSKCPQFPGLAVQPNSDATAPQCLVGHRRNVQVSRAITGMNHVEQPEERSGRLHNAPERSATYAVEFNSADAERQSTSSTGHSFDFKT